MARDRRVALLAHDHVWEDTSGGSLPFSYGARKLEASLRTAPDLADVETTVIDLRSGSVDDFMDRLREFRPSLIGASTYVWSLKLFLELAERVRAWDPSVRFVLGGPAARQSVLQLPPYRRFHRSIDAVVAGEGEEVIRAITRAHLRDDWARDVPGLHLPGPLGWRRTQAAERPTLDDYASPYQLGTVPRATWGYLESFRGCPISCAFCQWGDERSDRVHSTEYLASHLRGMEEAGVDTVFILDAAFNLSARAFRNLVDAERQVGVLRRCKVFGQLYPTIIRDEHIEFIQSFPRPEISFGIQSFDREVLRRLGRPFDTSRFDRVLEQIGERFDFDLELVCGLPGDNLESFRRTLDRSMELANCIRVFHCLALPDALIERAEEFHIDFDPETFRVRSCDGWSERDLAAGWEMVKEAAMASKQPVVGISWANIRMKMARDQGSAWPPRLRELGVDAIERLRQAVAAGGDRFRFAGARVDGERLILALDAQHGRMELQAEAAREGQAHFSRHGAIAYTHRGTLGSQEAPALRRFIEQLHGEVQPVLRELSGSPPSPGAPGLAS